MKENKFRLFTNQELQELIRTFQACKRDNKLSRALFNALSEELESRFK
jgi:chromosome segregation and condensation protein ScpB